VGGIVGLLEKKPGSTRIWSEGNSYCTLPVLPAILGHLTTGLRLAIGIAWIVLVPGEMLGVRAGLGYYILDARDRLSYSELTAVILVIGAIGYTLDTGLRIVQRIFAVRD